MESLVFIKYNQQLIERYNLKDEVDPITLNDIDECNEWLVGELGTATFQSDDNMKDDANLVHEGDNTLSWNLVFEAMGRHELTANTRRRKQNRKRKEPTAPKGGPNGSKASKKGKAVIVEEEEPEFEDSEDSENEEEEIQFNDTELDDDEGAERHNNNRVNLDEVDES
ncbi:hypothetical protein HN51_002943 [Arachis hypogaea]